MLLKTISNDKLTVQINLLGAELWSIKDTAENEYLWQGNPRYWSGRAITIFPYVARLTNGTYTLDGKTYHMSIHGFANKSLFEVTDCQKDSLTLKISDNETTFPQYPFHFEFLVTYRLVENKLFVDYTVNNLDSKTMYFGLGGHPGFNVPMEQGTDFTDYYLEFDADTIPKRVIFSEDCFVMDGQFTPFLPQNGSKYPLHHDMFDDDAIVLTDMPKQITLASEKSSHKICVSYPDMTYLGLWHMPKTDAPYICIEPWTSLPSRKNVVEDLAKQENLITLPANETYRNTWTVKII